MIESVYQNRFRYKITLTVQENTSCRAARSIQQQEPTHLHMRRETLEKTIVACG